MKSCIMSLSNTSLSAEELKEGRSHTVGVIPLVCIRLLHHMPTQEHKDVECSQNIFGGCKCALCLIYSFVTSFFSLVSHFFQEPKCEAHAPSTGQSHFVVNFLGRHPSKTKFDNYQKV